ncbi:hypothetical protein BJH93_14655 [Kocuria polaris]|nr:hypothetical protein [Kocuria polaris]
MLRRRIRSSRAGAQRAGRRSDWRARTFLGIVVATGTLIAGCAADAGLSDDLPDTSDWQVHSNDFLTFSYPDGWTVEEHGDLGDGESAGVQDENGNWVAGFRPAPVRWPRDQLAIDGTVVELDRRTVTTGASKDQVLLTTFEEPVRNPGIFVGYRNSIVVQLLASDQVEDYLELNEYSPGYWQNDDDWGKFSAEPHTIELAGESTEDPTLEQAEEFVQSERYRRILAMMNSVRE